MATSNSDNTLLKQYLLVPLIIVALVWAVFVAQLRFSFAVDALALYPRSIQGLTGIITSPLVHGGWQHLLLNSPPLLVSLIIIGYFYRDIAFRVCFMIWLTEGSLVWLFGRQVYHIGASGIVYGFIFFILISGLIRHNRRLAVVSLLVILLYGSMVWGIVPQGNNISWESHLFGAITGMAFAILFRHHGPLEDTPIIDEEPPEEDEYRRFDYRHRHTDTGI